ncbi:enoyl-CoA hydratase [Limnohabitans lacus]|uniref:Enoyl-CoA hydratase domain-containing protein 3, mitochondrial n=1 Tax=Limnohabitans lacus TaxID=3045173 RepID=A0ABT6X2X7_9BURK|nr:enoyl-CoA hydratase [Limnohabitans sp. HM2-2]MDI9232338.1 enoyl-CoA hydratase [Limnohabitans sp. HM2-2]
MTSTAHPSDILLHERDARGVHRLTLNSPSTFNTLGEAMLAALQNAFVQVEQDADARLVVLGAAGKAFCAGHNLKEMRAQPELNYYQKLFAQCTRMMLSIQSLPVPVIARVQGVATAAGCQLVAQCDLAVAAQGVQFGVNGIDVGLFCATPSVPLVRNMPAKQAMEMLLTGGFISADEACQRGLINRVAPVSELDAQVNTLVDAILAKPREAVRLGKALFYKQREMGIEAAYQLAGQTMACNMVHEVAQEGVQAFIEKRNPAWKP